MQKSLRQVPGSLVKPSLTMLVSCLTSHSCSRLTSVACINAWHMSVRPLLLDVQQAVRACSSSLDSAGAAEAVAASGLITALSSFLTVLTALDLSDNSRLS